MAPSYQRSASFLDRLTSFTNWPESVTQTAESVAAAGFRFTTVRDKVICDSCGGKLCNWKPMDDPLIEHLKYFPECEFLKRLWNREAETKDELVFDGRGEEEGIVGHSDSKHHKIQDIKKQRNTYNSICLATDGKTDKETGNKVGQVDDDWLRDQMESPTVQIVLNHGHAEEDVKTAIIERYEATREVFQDGSSLLEAVFDLQDRRQDQASSSNATHGTAKTLSSRTKCLSETGEETIAEPSKKSKEQRGPLFDETDSKTSKKKRGKAICVMCEEKEQGVVFFPCGHLSTCPECSVRVTDCSVCCKPVQHRLRVYLG